MENRLQTEQENTLLDILSVLFLCVFLVLSSIKIPVTSLIFLIAAVVLRLFSVLHTPLDLRLLAFFGGMLVWIAAGLTYTSDFSEGIRFFLRLFLCLLIGYMASRSRAYTNLFMQFFIPTCLFLLLTVYLHALLPDEMVGLYEKILRPDAYSKVLDMYKFSGKRPTGICGYTSTTGYILSFFSGVVFIRAASLLRDRQYGKGALYALLFLLSLLGIVLVSKRSLFLAVVLLCGLFLFFYYVRSAGRRLGILLLCIAALIVLLFVMQHSSLFSDFFDRLTNFEDGSYSSGRVTIYTRTFAMFLESPLIGRGSGSFVGEYAALYDPLGGGAHNIYLQLLCENGIPGLLIFGAFFVTMLLHAFRMLRRSREHDLLCISIFCQAVFLIYGIFGNPLYDEILLCMYCLFAFIPYTVTVEEEPDHA